MLPCVTPGCTERWTLRQGLALTDWQGFAHGPSADDTGVSACAVLECRELWQGATLVVDALGRNVEPETKLPSEMIDDIVDMAIRAGMVCDGSVYPLRRAIVEYGNARARGA
jgi:hypothetical protein